MKAPASFLLPICCLFLAPALVAIPTPAQAGAAGAEVEVQRPRTGIGVVLSAGRGRLATISFPTPKLALLKILDLTGPRAARGVANASYAVRTRSRPAHGVVRADFGAIGEVELRFEPSGKPFETRLPRGCAGPRPTVEFGRLRGTISLEGEGGYFRFSSREAQGVRERSFRLECRKGRASNVPPHVSLRELVEPFFLAFSFSNGGNIAVLNATAKTAGRSITLRAAHEAGGPPGADLQVSTLESGEDMAIGRGLSVTGGKGTLRTSLPGAHPATATLAPPAPFYGAASFFETSARSHSWTGSLGVRMPGLDLVLAGPRFHTSLCVLSPLKSPRGCDVAKPKPLLPARLGLIPAMERLHDR